MSTKKIDIRNPDKYLGKAKGDNQFARIAHVNHAMQVSGGTNETYQLDMGYDYFPEASRIIESGTVINYSGGPAWKGHKISGSVFPMGNSSGSFPWYLCTVKIALNDTFSPFSIIPYSLTGMVSSFYNGGDTPTFSPLGKGAMVYDNIAEIAAPLDNIYVQSYIWNQPDEDFIYQDLVLIVETDLEDYNFGAFYQFEFLLPEGCTATRFFD